MISGIEKPLPGEQIDRQRSRKASTQRVVTQKLPGRPGQRRAADQVIPALTGHCLVERPPAPPLDAKRETGGVRSDFLLERTAGLVRARLGR